MNLSIPNFQREFFKTNWISRFQISKENSWNKLNLSIPIFQREYLKQLKTIDSKFPTKKKIPSNDWFLETIANLNLKYPTNLHQLILLGTNPRTMNPVWLSLLLTWRYKQRSSIQKQSDFQKPKIFVADLGKQRWIEKPLLIPRLEFKTKLKSELTRSCELHALARCCWCSRTSQPWRQRLQKYCTVFC